MKINVYGIKDRVANGYGHPFLCANSPKHALAVRQFEEYIGTSGMTFNHADDFSLYLLGTYDDSNGEFVNNNEFVISGEQFTIGKEK